MTDDLQGFKDLARKPVQELRSMNVGELQGRILALATDMTDRREEKLQALGAFYVKLFEADRALFTDLLAPFLDVVRNDPSIDLFSTMLGSKAFNTSSLQAVLLSLLNDGTISVFEIESFLPRETSKAKQLALLAKLLKHASEGILRDTFMDLFIKVLMPESTFSMKPENFTSMEFMGEMAQSLGQLAFFFRKGYPVADVLAHIGDQQGPQLVLFIVLMLSQGIMKDAEIRALLDELDNEMFSAMYENAKKSMESMMPPGLKGAGMAGGAGGLGGLPFGPPGMAGRLAGSSIFQRIARKLFGIFGRFKP